MTDLRKYVTYKKGTIPVIFSVPHGGPLECGPIPRRMNGILGIDKGTIGLARKIISLMDKPSYIISNVQRSKIDMNREESAAYPEDSTLAEEIYQFYHSKIKELIEYNISTFNHSLLVDIHGFEKDKRPEGYRDVEIILGTENLKSLFSEPIPQKDWDKNIRGKIINKLLHLNIPIAPGHARRKEYVLTGGYITQQYGVSQIPKSQAIQIEFSDRIRLHDKTLKEKVLSNLVQIFSEEFYSLESKRIDLE